MPLRIKFENVSTEAARPKKSDKMTGKMTDIPRALCLADIVVPVESVVADPENKGQFITKTRPGRIALFDWPDSVDDDGRPTPGGLRYGLFVSEEHFIGRPGQPGFSCVDPETGLVRTFTTPRGTFLRQTFRKVWRRDLALFAENDAKLMDMAKKAGHLK